MINYINFINNFANTYLKDYLDLTNLKVMNIDAKDYTSMTIIDVECLYNNKDEFFTLSIFKENNTIVASVFTILFDCFSFEEKRKINKAVNKLVNDEIMKKRGDKLDKMNLTT